MIYFFFPKYEVDICRREQPYVIQLPSRRESHEMQSSVEQVASTSTSADEPKLSSPNVTPMEVDQVHGEPQQVALSTDALPNKDLQCYPQRAALLKSMLNFLKKAIQDPAFSDGIRHRKLQY